jgi:hypothetical protein
MFSIQLWFNIDSDQLYPQNYVYSSKSSSSVITQLTPYIGMYEISQYGASVNEHS